MEHPMTRGTQGQASWTLCNVAKGCSAQAPPHPGHHVSRRASTSWNTVKLQRGFAAIKAVTGMEGGHLIWHDKHSRVCDRTQAICRETGNCAVAASAATTTHGRGRDGAGLPPAAKWCLFLLLDMSLAGTIPTPTNLHQPKMFCPVLPVITEMMRSPFLSSPLRSAGPPARMKETKIPSPSSPPTMLKPSPVDPRWRTSFRGSLREQG